MSDSKRILLSEPGNPVIVRFLSGEITLGEDKTSTVTVLRTGHFSDPRYGRFEISEAMLLSMVDNFNKNTYGQNIFIDVEHNPKNGSAGTIKSLTISDGRLLAEVDWTEYGLEAVQKRGFIYLSADFHENFRDNETGEKHGTLLQGAGLTTRPVIKRLDPVRLSEPTAEDNVKTFFNPELAHKLSESAIMNMKELIKLLNQKFGELKLSEAIVQKLVAAFELSAKTLGEDKAAMEALFSQFEDTGKTLAEASGSGAVTLDIKMPDSAGGAGLTAADVEKLLAERDDARAADAKKLAETLETRQGQFDTLIDASEGLKALSEDSLAIVRSARDMITAEMSEDQVKSLAEHQIALGNQIAVNAKLAAKGFAGPSGSVHITVDDSNNVKALQESVDKRLNLSSQPDSRRYASTGGVLLAENKALADEVLAMYDARHGDDLAREHKLLSGGDGVVADVAVPAIFERTVIREAVYQLVGLQFVDSGTLPFASSALIPYSHRDPAAAGRNNTRTYEGGSIPRAGVIQDSETAYPIPQKIAFEVSDELRYLTQSGILNWDALVENQRNASRIIAEDTEQMIFNEQLRAADEYVSVAVSAEDLGPKTNGTNRIFTLVNFPVVHPRAQYDLNGSQVGATVNPITVTFKGGAINEYDGSGAQAAGDYYVINYNVGEIYIVNEAGVIQTPGGTDALLVDYSYATNAFQFDTDPGAADVDAHWDGFLYRYGLRKSVIEDQRYHRANFGLMSGTAMTQIEQAKQFGANSKRPGTDLSMDGNLGRVKDIPNFKTSAPGLWMGDQRVVLGERGQTRLRMMKPWTMGELENQKDANGRFTGKKEAYGDQFLILHTPTQLKRALTSIVLFSAAARIDRVNL